jgi:hypothetical protein
MLFENGRRVKFPLIGKEDVDCITVYQQIEALGEHHGACANGDEGKPGRIQLRLGIGHYTLAREILRRQQT